TTEHSAAEEVPQDAPGRDLAAELAQMEDRYKRALADLDNYRRRTARETERRVAEGRDALLLDWLEAVDSVDRALGQIAATHPAAPGLRAVLDQLEAILDRQGVNRVGAVGEPFDPERHEAVGVRETAETPDRTVAEIARSGFARGEQVLRPAQVIVARAPAGDR
ncbi:MAG TPA: nucleotide exchange factor GrpE, partial [Steroidobacteraceae bacterium]|nr:nucleotide exchange factor GrpE [Steroidobacteraceae bacterium]